MRPTTKPTWSACDRDGLTSRSCRSCVASNTRHGTADATTQSAEIDQARRRSRSRRTSSAANPTAYRTARNATASRFVASAAAAKTVPSAICSRRKQQNGADEEAGERDVRVGGERLVARGGHPEEQAQAGRQRPRGDVRAQHGPRDEREAGEEDDEEHVQDARVRAADRVQNVRLERRQAERVLAMDGGSDRRAEKAPVEIQELRLQHPVRERVVLVDGLLRGARREQDERHGEHEQRERLDVQSAPARPPEQHAGDQRKSAEREHDRHRRRQSEVHERRQQHHRRRHPREHAEPDTERRSRQEQDSRAERQRAPPAQARRRGARGSPFDEPVSAEAPGAPRPDARLARRPVDEHGPARVAHPRRRGEARSRTRPSGSSPSA